MTKPNAAYISDRSINIAVCRVAYCSTMDDVLIPVGVDIRIRFESSVETFLSSLAEQLQTNAEGVFFVQQDPFYIKVVPSGIIRGSSSKRVTAILQQVGARFDDVKGEVLPICVVDGDGRVSLKISSNDCARVIGDVSRVILDGNRWSVHVDDDLLVSIGSFKGPQTNAFENWLNGELRSNSSAFPSFNAECIQLYGGSSAFMQQSVRLTKKEIIFDSDIVVHSLDLDLDTESNQEAENDPQQLEAAVAIVCSIETIVLEISKSSAAITQKINGTAVIKKEVRKSSQTTLTNVTRYSVIPSDFKQWQEECSNMTQILKATLLSVGSQDFLEALDVLANFNYPDSLSSALQPILDSTPGSFLELVPIRDMHIEAKSDSEDESVIAHLEGLEVTLAAADYTDPQCSSTSSSSLLCYLAGGKQTLLDYRFSESPCPTPNRALLTVHISPTSLSALGLTPLNGRKDFYLPFAWIDVKDPSITPRPSTHNGRNSTYTHGSQVRGPYIPGYSGYKGSNGARPHGVGHNGAHSNGAYVHQNNATHAVNGRPSVPSSVNSNTNTNGYTNGNGNNTHYHNSHNNGQAPSTQRPAPPSHQGDWICPACKALVYSFRPDCYKCHTLRPDPGPVVPRQPHSANSRSNGDVRDGDWQCVTCKGHNFANKLACFTCRTPKPSTHTVDSPEITHCAKPTATTDTEAANAISGLESVDQIEVELGVEIEEGIEKEVETEVSKIAERLPRALPGDWTCPSCHENVFAKRYRCYKCCTPKPR